MRRSHITISPEEAIALALITYINGEPPHTAGLCFYLARVVEGEMPGWVCRTESGVSQFDRLTIDAWPDPYTLVARLRKRFPAYNQTDYLGNKGDGPNPERLEFAQFMLDLLESGRLTMCLETYIWQLDGEDLPRET